MLMILPKQINEKFYNAIIKKRKEYGRGFNKFLCGETGYTSGYISQVLNGNQDASQEAQTKICDAVGIDYKTFLEEEPSNTEAPPDNIVNFKSDMQRKHFDVIQTFDDAETALHFNEFLSKLEKLDVAKYEEMYGKVRGYVKEIENKLNPRKELGQSPGLGEAQKRDA